MVIVIVVVVIVGEKFSFGVGNRHASKDTVKGREESVIAEDKTKNMRKHTLSSVGDPRQSKGLALPFQWLIVYLGP